MELLRFIPAVVVTALGLYLWLFVLPIFVLTFLEAFRMKAIKTIVNKAFINGVATAFSGNHGFKCVPGTPEVVFYYHGNPVCVVNLHTKSFKLDDCGYKTSSTTRTLNAYRDELTARGFTCSQFK